jgi:hypothetical protein
MKIICGLLVASALVSGLYATSASAELITNGGFESGDLAGWTVSATENNYVGSSELDYVPFGTYALYMGCVDNLCSTSQAIATTAGQRYIFSFEYGSDGETPNEFIANFGSATLFHRTDDASITMPGFQHHSFTVVATGASTVVEFLGANPNGFLALDNVSVEALVPAPGSIELFMAGIAAFGLSCRAKFWRQRRVMLDGCRNSLQNHSTSMTSV